MSRPGARSRFTKRRLAIGLAAGSLLLLVLMQLFLPSLASRWAESQTDKYGEDVHVNVEAFPAVKLLFRRADDVRMRAKSLAPEGDYSLLGQLKNTTKLTSEIETLDAGRVPLRDVHFEKRGDGAFEMSGFLERSDLEAELPAGVTLRRARSVPNHVPGRIGSGVLGEGVDSDLELGTSDGAIVLRVHLPGVLDLVSLAPITVFRDSHLAAKRFEMTRAGGGWKIELRGAVK